MRPKTYWRSLKKTFTSPSYFLEITKAPFWFSFRFFIISMVLLAISWAIRINLKTIPYLQKQVEVNLENIENNYPSDLEISWTGKALEISPAEKLMIPYPIGFEDPQLPAVFAYLVPMNFSSDQFQRESIEDSLLVITTENLFINNLQESWNSAPLSELLPDQQSTLNQTSLPEFNNLLNFIKSANFVVLPLVLITSQLWVGFFEAILVFLFFKLNRVKIKFSKTFQLSLHLVIIAEFIHQVTAWLYPNIEIPMFTIAYWLVFTYIFWTQRKKFPTIKS